MKLAYSDDTGTAYEHPTLLAAVRSGADNRAARDEEWVDVPETGGTLSALPGRKPVGVDPSTGKLVVLDEMTAVGVLFPPGWTRTLLPATERQKDAPTLPLFAYTAVAYHDGRLVGAAVRTDTRTHWDPEHYNTADLDERIEARLAKDPDNKILKQVARCAHEYRCFTAQNVFYRRSEAAIPLSTVCNAACIGCLSQQDEGGPPPSQWRIAVGPTVEECVRLTLDHFAHAGEAAIVSWGQGCEGEPLTRWEVIAEVCRRVREQTSAGVLHVNTNGSDPAALVKCAQAGLDSVRISLNAAEPTVYTPYYRPRNYTFEDVRASIVEAKAAGLIVHLNLLVFPGVNDRTEQIAALLELVELGVDNVQTRNLCIDPELYLETVGPGGPAEGVGKLVTRLQSRVTVGNFNG